MKFSLILFFLFLLGASANASDLTVKVTSFTLLDSHSRLAEFCGQVEGTTPSSMTQIHVAVDQSTVSPGSYNTLADSSGAFCLVLRTLTGVADATATSSGQSAQIFSRIQ